MEASVVLPSTFDLDGTCEKVTPPRIVNCRSIGRQSILDRRMPTTWPRSSTPRVPTADCATLASSDLTPDAQAEPPRKAATGNWKAVRKETLAAHLCSIACLSRSAAV